MSVTIFEGSVQIATASNSWLVANDPVLLPGQGVIDIDNNTWRINIVELSGSSANWSTLTDFNYQTPGGSAKHVIQDEGASQTARTNLNFVGAAVTVTDDAGNDATVVTVTALQSGDNISELVNDAGYLVNVVEDLTPQLGGDLDAQNNDINNVSELNFNTALSTPTHAEGMVFYDQVNKCLAVYNDEADITLQVGQEQYVRVFNNSAGTITNGSAVYASGETSGFPNIRLALATTETKSDVIGFATHDIEVGTYGYITRNGIVRDLNTVGLTAGDPVYLSTSVAGGIQSTAPSLPFFEVHLGHVVTVGASGSILIEIWHREPDYVELAQINDGMAFDKLDIYVVNDGGTLYFEVEKEGTGNADFLIDGTRSTLDCTTGSGTGGRARVALTAGVDANTPQVNYLYTTDSSGTATLAASTSLPTGAFGWVGKVVVPDATTWNTEGEYLIQRYTESFSNNNRGALSHQREKLRALGAVYISGGTQTLTITPGSPDSVHLEVGSAEVYQLHRQTFPAFTTGPYYYGNGLDQYEKITDLNAALALQDGTAITNNDRYNLVIWGAVNLESGDCKLFVNLASDVYGADATASADSSATADYSVPDDFRSVAFLISRVVLKYTTAGGGTFTEVDTFSLLGVPVGVRTGGSGGVVASTEFVDSTFRIFDSGLSTRKIAFELSGISDGTTRTYTAPNSSGTLALQSYVDTEVKQKPESFIIACSDESTPITDNAIRVTFRMPYAFTLTDIRASLTSACTTGTFEVDVKEANTTIMSTNKLTFDATQTTTVTATTPPDISDASLADNAEMTINIVDAGDGSATGLKVILIGYQT